MDPPETANANGPRAARLRSSRAVTSGSVRAIADVPFRFEADDPARAAVLEEFSAAWDPAPVSRADLSIDPVPFHFTSTALPLPAGAADVTADDLSFWRLGDRAFIEDGIRCRGLAEPASISVSGPARLRNVERVAGTLLGHVLAGMGLVTLHAAAFLLPNGGTVIAMGPSGAGKSTLAAIALQLGWRILSDDLCVVRGGTSLAATGIPRAPTVPAEVASGLDGEVIPGDGDRGRIQLPVSVLQRGWHPVVALLHIAHSDTVTSVIESRGPRALLTDVLHGQTGSLSPAHVRSLLPMCAAMARLPGFDLHHGRDTVERAASTAECLVTLERTVGGAPV